MTLKFNRVSAVVAVHEHGENSDENNTVRRYRGNSNNLAP